MVVQLRQRRLCRTNVTSWSRVTPGSQADDEKVKCGYFMTESIVIKELLVNDSTLMEII